MWCDHVVRVGCSVRDAIMWSAEHAHARAAHTHTHTHMHARAHTHARMHTLTQACMEICRIQGMFTCAGRSHVCGA